MKVAWVTNIRQELVKVAQICKWFDSPLKLSHDYRILLLVVNWQKDGEMPMRVKFESISLLIPRHG